MCAIFGVLDFQGELTSPQRKTLFQALAGTFTITVLDAQNVLYLVKGNNPLVIRLFPDLGCYLYASTAEILDITLGRLGLSKLSQTDIPIRQGDIMAIDASGQRTVTRFDDSRLWTPRYFCGWDWPGPIQKAETDDYLETVLDYGKRHGVSEWELRLLMDAGYDALDLEEMIHDAEFRENCVREIMADFGVC